MKCRKRKPILFRMRKLEMKIKRLEEERYNLIRVTNELNTLRSQQQLQQQQQQQQQNQVMVRQSRFELSPAQVQIEPNAPIPSPPVQNKMQSSMQSPPQLYSNERPTTKSVSPHYRAMIPKEVLTGQPQRPSSPPPVAPRAEVIGQVSSIRLGVSN